MMTQVVTATMTYAGRKTTVRCRQHGRRTMTSAGTQDDDVSNDASRTSNGSLTDESWTDVRRKSDEQSSAAATAMAGGDSTLQLLATLQQWPGALQLAALLRRWPATHCSLQRSSDAAAATRWTSQRCCDGQQRAGLRSVAAMADSALDLAACCCDVRQCARPRSVAAMSDNVTTSANAALQRFCFCFCLFFFFYPTTLRKKKNGREREVLTPALQCPDFVCPCFGWL